MVVRDIPGFPVCALLRAGWHQKPLALWPIEPTIWRPSPHPRSVKWLVVVVGREKDRRLLPRNLRPPPSKATASQQSMSCMKHLIEAERESSVPSSKPRKLRMVTQVCAAWTPRLRRGPRHEFGVPFETHRINYSNHASGRPNSSIQLMWRSSRLARTGDFFI